MDTRAILVSGLVFGSVRLRGKLHFELRLMNLESPKASLRGDEACLLRPRTF